jgi:hypothetical protein
LRCRSLNRKQHGKSLAIRREIEVSHESCVE